MKDSIIVAVVTTTICILTAAIYLVRYLMGKQGVLRINGQSRRSRTLAATRWYRNVSR